MAVIPHLVVSSGVQAIEFYTKAFGATEVMRMPAPDGQRLMHAQLKVGDSDLFLVDDFPEYCDGKSRDPLKMGGTSVVLHQYVPSADEAIARAAAAGATVTMPAQDMFWGDRYGQVVDPFGHTWSFAHKLEK